MKKIGIYTIGILLIVIIIPSIIVMTFNFTPKENRERNKFFTSREEDDNEVEEGKELFDGYIKVYDTRNQQVIHMELEEYVKGVVAAEMPGEFHIEALKAQAVASRTYAISRTLNYKEGHPDHIEAPLCTGIHCQAYLTLDELKTIHAKDWEEKYWPKIEEAVNSTKGQALYYDGEIIEPLYHSTSGGMTEDALDVFAIDRPYLKSVESPYEEDAPKFRSVVTMTGDEFINKILRKYPSANITKDNLGEKIKLVEKTKSGRIKKIAIDGTVVNGREIRELFDLNSTNFKITYNPKSNIVDIETIGYGHGVGMSQWGANGMAKNGKDYEEILKHYYTGVQVKQLTMDN
ncbi:stage II sporulation protein D [Tepidimicrobium xylanilyticum]|uniref:Stage II sporulation protein D n=1 Tax=Tepidimicrobium xylanilyticum TaxID=1123352 RepID=A0A1H2QYR3_9FIRM|nr:stage II sporulation protein D [Tepidimicrobium xylanilyticum]GMG95557.1 stage II sporulation protein D [Tepidimicrobium xylanilyticum]SDW12068.1 stage II sporulation protein D [Tepidimicrobium xylanilyticum]